MKTFFPTLLLGLCFPLLLQATHNRAGQIEYIQFEDFSIGVRIITYTKASSVDADRDSLIIFWGDGTSTTLARSNGFGVPPQGEFLENDIKFNVYFGEHTYSEYGPYNLSVSDPNRNFGIVNIPDSGTVPFHIETRFLLEALVDGASTGSPTLLTQPIDVAYAGQPFFHTPNAFDFEGDSIAYELITPLAAPDLEVPMYSPINSIEMLENGDLIFNEETGLLIWDVPMIVGEFSVAYAIKTYRDGIEIGYMIRDMQILVLADTNEPPQIVIDANQENVIEVQVGETITLEVSAEDVEAEQMVVLTASSGLLNDTIFAMPATFEATSLGNTAIGTFSWIVTADFVREQPYQVVFKAKDDFMGIGAVNFGVVRFRVNMPTHTTETIAESLLLFPNPTHDILWINNAEAGVFQIVDALGQIVNSGRIDTSKQSISVKGLAKGQYFIILESFEGTKVGVFVKQ